MNAEILPGLGSTVIKKQASRAQKAPKLSRLWNKVQTIELTIVAPMVHIGVHYVSIVGEHGAYTRNVFVF